VSFTQVATVLKGQIQLRVRFFEELARAMSLRSNHLDFDEDGTGDAERKKQDASDKFFQKFDLKNEAVLHKVRVRWSVNCRLHTVCGKLFVSKNYLAMLAKGFGTVFRWVSLLVKVTNLCVLDSSVHIISSVLSQEQRVVIYLESEEAAETLCQQLKALVATATVPPQKGFVAEIDNRAWEYLLAGGAESMVVRHGERLNLSSNSMYYVAAGKLQSVETPTLVARRGTSFGQGAFFSGKIYALHGVVGEAQEDTVLYGISRMHLSVLQVSRPDIASNFLRYCGLILAERLVKKDRVASISLIMLKEMKK
jgi:hypothetical protein